MGVYYKAHTRQRKLNLKWKPYYKMAEWTGLVSHKIWDQIGRKVKSAHANYLKLIKIEDREVPEWSRNT